MILKPCNVYVMYEIDVRNTVYLEILLIEDIYLGNKGYPKLLAYQGLNGILIGAFTQYVRLYTQITIQPVGISAET